eukprot:CAMPEP_0179912696 /NCGR_PEP_ID=MMETSP0983-20121128/14_1 /TAXON_ID=483367 /ORGANISM="non described non described, Strain CCMP 2436" /LENGTH=163 /DNA_ID=CAMNT_0021814535 /DNA_START=499 /DNA_END=986 /DNA_ORIENTATION=-
MADLSVLQKKLAATIPMTTKGDTRSRRRARAASCQVITSHLLLLLRTLRRGTGPVPATCATTRARRRSEARPVTLGQHRAPLANGTCCRALARRLGLLRSLHAATSGLTRGPLAAMACPASLLRSLHDATSRLTQSPLATMACPASASQSTSTRRWVLDFVAA